MCRYRQVLTSINLHEFNFYWVINDLFIYVFSLSLSRELQKVPILVNKPYFQNRQTFGLTKMLFYVSGLNLN